MLSTNFVLFYSDDHPSIKPMIPSSKIIHYWKNNIIGATASPVKKVTEASPDIIIRIAGYFQ